jgi:hypothetical protein
VAERLRFELKIGDQYEGPSTLAIEDICDYIEGSKP